MSSCLCSLWMCMHCYCRLGKDGMKMAVCFHIVFVARMFFVSLSTLTFFLLVIIKYICKNFCYNILWLDTWWDPALRCCFLVASPSDGACVERQMIGRDSEFQQVPSSLETYICVFMDVCVDSSKWRWRPAYHFGHNRSECSAVSCPVPETGQVGTLSGQCNESPVESRRG